MSVKITINGEGLTLERDINMQQAGQIITFLSTEKNNNQNINYQIVSDPVLELPSKPKLSPNALIIDSDAKTFAEKITVLGRYISTDTGQEYFSMEEIKLILKKLGDFPKKFSREVKRAIDLGYIYQEDGGYVVTTRGIEAIDSKFIQQNIKSKVTKKVHSKRTKSNSTDNINPKLRDIEIVTEYKGLPKFHDLSSKREKILWILIYANRNEIDTLSTTDIEYIASKLQDSIPSRDFASHNKRNISNALVAQKNGMFRILKKGEDSIVNLSAKISD